jgi:hypothetical protein
VCLPIAVGAAVVGAKRARRSVRLRRSDPRGLAAGVRAELVAALVDRGAQVAPNATPTELRRKAERVLATPAGTLTEALAEARYGPASGAAAPAARARAELGRLLSAAAARERPGDRLHTALSLRSLRPGLTRSAG